MDIAIVGGSGFIGGHIAQHLAKNNNIKIIDIRPPNFSHENVKYVECDVLDEKKLEKVLKGNDTVIDAHIIQIPKINENKEMGFKVNIYGTRNVCECCRKNGSDILLISSWHLYGEPPFEKEEIKEDYGYHLEKVGERARFYAKNKVMQELIVRSFNDIYGIPSKILRIATVLGEGMPEKTAANIFINQALEGKAVTPYRSSRYRPMIYVDVNDVKEAVKRFLEIESKGCEIIHVSYPDSITVEELAHMVKEVSGSSSEIKVVDDKEEEFKAGDKRNSRLDISRLKKKLNFNELISTEESLKRIIQNSREK